MNFSLISRQLYRAALLALALLGSAAQAHTSLTASMPADGAVLNTVQQITLEFGAPLQLVSVTLHHSADQPLDIQFKRPAAMASRFEIPLPTALAAATYQVKWLAMGKDGHKISGDFRFEVNAAAKPEAAAVHAKADQQLPLLTGLEQPAALTVLAFHQALQQGQAAQAEALLADDVLIYEGGGVERSKAEYKSHHLAADMAYLKQMQISTLEHQVFVNGDSAWSVARSQVKGQYKDKAVDRQGMESIFLVRQQGKWLMAWRICCG